MSAAILGFEEQKRRLDVQIAELRAMLPGAPAGATASTEPKTRKKRVMSAAGRKAIAEAQRKRWATTKATTETPKVAKKTRKAKRKLSDEGRAAIVAALKKRWAAKKSA